MSNNNSSNSFKVIVALVLIVFSYGLYHRVLKKKELKESSEYTTGVITKKYRIPQRGYYVHYNYNVGDKFFEGSQNISKEIELNDVNKGDRFRVKYSSENPNYSELLFDKKIDDE